MMLELNNDEMKLLIYNMSTMRKNVRTGFKSNYGRKEGKQKLKLYDSVVEDLTELYEIAPESEEYETPLSEDQADMLDSFLDFYIPKLEEEEHAEGDQVVQLLKNVHSRIELPEKEGSTC